MPKVVKKSAVKANKVSAKVSKTSDASQMVMAAVIVIFTVLIAPVAWWVTQTVWVLYAIPAVVSGVAAVMFKNVTGRTMSEQFRQETTTTTAVFAVVLAVLMALNLPNLELDGSVGNVLPIFMIIFLSVLAIVSVLVTVYLPLGLTVEKKK